MDNDHESARTPGHEWGKPLIREVHAPDWVGESKLDGFLYWHGTRKNLKRVLKFVHGKPRRDTTDLVFVHADMVRARIDTRSRQVTFFDPQDENSPQSVLDLDELAELFEFYIKLGGFPDRDPSLED